MIKKVTLYSDGACSGNPGPGGYGAMLVFDETSQCISKGYKFTTNNRMELLGIIEPLETLEEKYDVHIITDSQYVSNAINKKWIESWIKRGWKTWGRKPVKNQDLWERFVCLLDKHVIDIKWVKGHNGYPENEYCDKLAVEARNSQNLISDRGYHDS